MWTKQPLLKPYNKGLNMSKNKGNIFSRAWEGTKNFFGGDTNMEKLRTTVREKYVVRESEHDRLSRMADSILDDVSNKATPAQVQAMIRDGEFIQDINDAKYNNELLNLQIYDNVKVIKSNEKALDAHIQAAFGAGKASSKDKDAEAKQAAHDKKLVAEAIAAANAAGTTSQQTPEPAGSTKPAQEESLKV